MRVCALGVVVAVSLGLLACSDDGGSGSGPGVGGGAGSGGSMGGSGGAGGSSGSGGSTGGSGGSAGSAGSATGGSAGSAGAAGLSCQSYCTTIMENCQSENAQYPSMESCLAVCATFPEGTPDDTSGNTLGCRTYHAGAAKGTAADATMHCPHSGPAGVGLCGSNCEGYCNIIVPTCPGEFSGGMSECLADCESLNGKDATEYTTASTAGDSLQCRIYHASVAAESTDSALMHCPHAGITPSDFCK